MAHKIVMACCILMLMVIAAIALPVRYEEKGSLAGVLIKRPVPPVGSSTRSPPSTAATRFQRYEHEVSKVGSELPKVRFH